MRLHFLPLASLTMLMSLVPGGQIQTASPAKDYVSQIEASRKERDKRFLDEKSSPLGVVAVIKLDSPRVTIGSNPSCAYNNGFACPIPPAENRLPVAIRAGEKAFSHH